MTKISFTVLGCGTSTGVPVPGCPCPVCTSGDPKNRRLRTSGVLRLSGGETILIDAGTDLRQQALEQKLHSIDAILFTHQHSDHILGIDDLRCFNFHRPAPIPAFGTDTTLVEIEVTFRYLFQHNHDYLGGLLTQIQLHRIEHGKSFECLGETVTPFLLWHGPIPVTGFRIRDFVYATDCNRIPPESIDIMTGAKVLFLDALRHRPHKTHFTIAEAISTAEQLKAQQTYFIHMSHDIDYHPESEKLPPGISYAYDGLTVEIS
jgi:phosphoribosyl 1,2-cyclic phosphate phosphodiesterase